MNKRRKIVMMMNSFSLKNEEEKKAMFKNFLGLDLKKTP